MSSVLSRRNFLKTTSTALTLSWLARAQGQRPTIMYVGTYTARGAGIYRFSVNPTTGELTLLGVTGDVMNPSFVALDPAQRYLYSVNEIGNFEGQQSGSVTAYRVEPDGNLTFLNRQATSGANPAHISVDPTGRFALAANYSGGNVAVFPIQPDGSIAAASDVVKDTGPLGPNTGRQEAAHAHMILPDTSGRFVLVNDLGLDRTFIHRLEGSSGKLIPSDPDVIIANPGAGPRHLAFHPNGKLLLVIAELDSTIRSYTWDATRGLATAVQTISTLPENFRGTSTTAHVVVAPSGRFVYGSNRGHDSIALFSVDPDTGRMQFVERTWTMGETPRNFAIDPTGNFMYVGHQNTDNIVVFRIDQATGKLTPTGLFYGAGQPVCFTFLRPPSTTTMVKDGVTFWADPNPIVINDNSGLGQTTLSWNAPGVSSVEIRIGSPTGATMGSNPSYGSTTTGKWVGDGMTFYLQDGANTLGSVRVSVRRA